MYPFMRMGWQFALNRIRGPIGFDETHISRHICTPFDIDFWMEMNNGRILTLYDLGRIPFAARTGLLTVLKENRWGITVAGSTTRYRHRVRLFDRIELHSAALGRDERFLYLMHTMWHNGKAVNSALIRSAVTSQDGIVPTDRVAAAMGVPDWNPDLPEWIKKWIEVENIRSWPPEV